MSHKCAPSLQPWSEGSWQVIPGVQLMYLGNWRLFTLAPFRFWSTMPCYRAGALDTHRHMTHYARPDFELAELMHEYSLGSARNVRRVEGGTVNKNWIVRTTKETVVVRSVAQELSCSDIKFEHSFIRALGRCGFPYQLPQPLRTRTGRTFVMKNGAYVWLYNYIEGSNCEPSREEISPRLRVPWQQRIRRPDVSLYGT